MTRFRTATLALLCATAAAGAFAADKVDRADKKFIDKAAAGGMFEVQVSQLAADKSSDPEVKAFAQMLVQHHTAANGELKQVADAKGVAVPAELPMMQRRKVESLSKKSGADFDRAYINDVGLDAHKTDIKLFQKESANGKDADVRGFATKTLPTLKEHLAAAEKLKGEGKANKKS